ncbi:MAG: Ig-like domain-containing protein, partial [Nitrospira sp.]|nr:Ig-like domain-containing protein [Nitrospira sp.]
VSGHANAALGVSSVRVRVGSEDPMDAIPRAANDWSLWEANISVSNDGTHRVVATAFDAACNWDKDSRYFGFDTHPPNVTVTSHTSGEMIRASTFTLSGTARDYPFSSVQWVKVQVDNNPAIDAEGADPWMRELTSLPEGSHGIKVTARDYAGFEAFTVMELTVDVTAPDIRIQEPANNTVIETSTFLLRGTLADPISGIQNIQYKIDDSGAWINLPSSSSWSFNVPELDDGLHIISLRAEDRAGNTSPVLSLFITVNTPTPSTPVITSPDHNTVFSDNRPLIRGKAPLGSSSIDVFDETVLLGTAIPSGDTWSFTPSSSLLDGTHEITASARDASGTVLSSSNAIT